MMFGGRREDHSLATYTSTVIERRFMPISWETILTQSQPIRRSIFAGAFGGYAINDYVCIGEDTILEAVRRFTNAVIDVFGSEYLRASIEDDTQRLMIDNEARGWSGILWSFDCMHWTWKNCPAGWKGQYNSATIQRSFLRQLHRRVFGYGVHYLVFAWLS